MQNEPRSGKRQFKANAAPENMQTLLYEKQRW